VLLLLWCWWWRWWWSPRCCIGLYERRARCHPGAAPCGRPTPCIRAYTQPYDPCRRRRLHAAAVLRQVGRSRWWWWWSSRATVRLTDAGRGSTAAGSKYTYAYKAVSYWPSDAAVRWHSVIAVTPNGRWQWQEEKARKLVAADNHADGDGGQQRDGNYVQANTRIRRTGCR
jgi:hypothetical protein